MAKDFGSIPSINPSRNVSVASIKDKRIDFDRNSIQDSSIVNIDINNQNTPDNPMNQLSFVNRYVSNRTLEKNASIKSIVLPPIQQNSLQTIESSMSRINHEVRNKNRVEEMLRWARNDYGVKLVQNHHAQRMLIRDPLRKEVNFILKVKQ